MKKKKFGLIYLITVLVVSVALAIIGYLILPETVVTQIGNGSDNSTSPRAFGLLLPFALSTLFAFAYYKLSDFKYLFASVIGLFCWAMLFIINL